MLDETGAIEIMVLRAIGDGPTDLGTGQDLATWVLPSHRLRRQVPAVRARDAGAVGVGLLVTGRAPASRNTLALGPAQQHRAMAMPIVALLRIGPGSVAADATMRRQHV